MAEFTNLTPTTELQAVNQMLSAIGEAPVDSITGSQPDLAMAKNHLRETLKEIQLEGWRYNLERDLQLAPDGTVEWSDVEGESTTLNVWERPSNLAKWQLSKVTENDQYNLDLVLRESKQYTDGGGSKVVVFYDRDANRDGLDADDYDYIWIDAVWFFDFENCPQSIRRLATVRAARRLAEDAVGSKKLSDFSKTDERIALRNLLRDQGLKDRRNLFRNPDIRHKLGRTRRFRRTVWAEDDRW